MRGTRLIALSGWLATCWSSPANAADPQVAVAPIRAEGELREVALERIEAGLREGVKAAGAQVIDGQSLRDQVPELSPCADAACLVSLREQGQFEHAVSLSVQAEGRDYRLELTFVDASNQVSTTEAECTICGFDEVAALARDLASALAPKLSPSAAATLSVTTDPPGAKIFVDEVEVGVSPLELEVSSGTHEIRVEREGYFPEDKSIVFVEGTSESRNFDLRARVVQVDNKRERRRAALGWSALGAGLGMLGGGAYFLAIHHDAPSSRCDASNIDANGVCRFRYNTLPQGAVLTALGASALTLGATVLIGQRLARKERKLSVSVGPRSVLLRGRF